MFWSGGLGWAFRICISNKFPVDVDATVLGTTLCILNAVVGRIMAPKEDHVLILGAYEYNMPDSKGELIFWMGIIYN